jgi:hypothetical protein
VNVTYRQRETIVLTEPTVVNLDMKKVVRREVDLVWDEAGQTVAPGGSADFFMTVTNRGNADDTYTLSASLTGFTFAFIPQSATIPFGSTGNVRTVRVTVTAARDARVDHAPMTVNVESTADSTVAKSVSLQLDVTRYRGLAADVSTNAPEWDGRFLRYTLQVRNAGNGQDSFQLTLPNYDELLSAGWRATFVDPSGAPQAVLNVTVGGNTTSRPVLRLEKVFGSAGATVSVQVTNTEDVTYSDLVTVQVQMPVLALEGRLRAIGPDLNLAEPGIDLAAAALLVSLVATIGAAVYLSILRRKSR